MESILIKPALSGVKVGTFLETVGAEELHIQATRQFPAGIPDLSYLRGGINAVDTDPLGTLGHGIADAVLAFGPGAQKIVVQVVHRQAAGTVDIVPIIFSKDNDDLGYPLALLEKKTSTALLPSGSGEYWGQVLEWTLPAGAGVGFFISAVSGGNSVDLWVGIDSGDGYLTVPVIYAGKAFTSGGGGNFLYLDPDGDLHGWGYNGDRNTNPASATDPWTDTDDVLTGRSIVKVAGSWNHTLILDDSGDVYAFGYNVYRQANPASATDPWTDATTLILADVIDIACGGNHSVALKSNGDVVAWGRNNRRQANPASATTPWTDTTNVIASGCTAIACGENFTLALKANGDVIGWGANAAGQIDPSLTTPWTNPATVIVSGIAQIFAGSVTSFFIDATGGLRGLGANGVNRLVAPDLVGDYSTDPTIVRLENIDHVACDGYHTAVVTTAGWLHIWGSNIYRETDPDSEDATIFDITTPLMVDVLEVAVAEHATLVITEAGTYHGWGLNDCRQVNPASATTPWVSKTAILSLAGA